MKYLHITNGDITTNQLQSLNLEGDFITWREMLCEGKTTTEVGSEFFWKTRFDFLNSSYKITKKRFIDLTLKEYRSLCNQKHQDEIILWFDYDLFCQINMLAVISWLKRYRKGRKISIIQSSKTKDDQQEIIQLSSQNIDQVFNNRIELNQDDIEYADYIWQLYCSNSPLRLETVHNFNPLSPFIHLEKAIKTHLLRFPSIENGLNNIENTILSEIKDHKFTNQNDLIKHLIEKQSIYGYGDIQYINKLKELKKLFTSLSPIKLSKTGLRVLEQQVNFYGKIRSDFSYLGGSKKYSYLYVSDNDKLLKISS